MTHPLYCGFPAARNTAQRDPALVRLTADHRRLLGCDAPALLWQPDRVRTWLASGVVPPTLRVQRDHEIETLTSSIIAQLGHLDVPVIVLFERGPAGVRHWTNVPVCAAEAR
jgi:hypothetical protein